jgi:[ribosomal protein S5]-alanine N-acetyltransferase
MQPNYKTERLILSELTTADSGFIFELVNTAAWIKFIGERNVRSNEDAIHYIQNIIANPDINYWVVKSRDQQIAVGIITFIKRDYLEQPDIGFAFLPAYTKKGYAFEATFAVLGDLLRSKQYKNILATTIKENESSIQLLNKLGFTYSCEIINNDKILHLYSVDEDKLCVI